MDSSSSRPFLKISPNEAEMILSKERKKWQIFRLQQVRAQAKEEAMRLNEEVKKEEQRQKEILKMKLKETWHQKNKEKLDSYEKTYSEGLLKFGEAHKNAEVQRNLIKESEVRKQKDNNTALERGRKALSELDKENLEKKQREMGRNLMKRGVLTKEKRRAAKVANLPTPQKFKVHRVVAKLPPKKVLLYEAGTFTTSEYVPSDIKVVKEKDEPAKMAFAAAEHETQQRECDEKLRELKERERQEKIEERAKIAEKKQLAKQQHTRLIRELGNADDNHQLSQFLRADNEQVFPVPVDDVDGSVEKAEKITKEILMKEIQKLKRTCVELKEPVYCGLADQDFESIGKTYHRTYSSFNSDHIVEETSQYSDQTQDTETAVSGNLRPFPESGTIHFKETVPVHNVPIIKEKFIVNKRNLDLDQVDRVREPLSALPTTNLHKDEDCVNKGKETISNLSPTRVDEDMFIKSREALIGEPYFKHGNISNTLPPPQVETKFYQRLRNDQLLSKKLASISISSDESRSKNETNSYGKVSELSPNSSDSLKSDVLGHLDGFGAETFDTEKTSYFHLPTKLLSQKLDKHSVHDNKTSGIAPKNIPLMSTRYSSFTEYQDLPSTESSSEEDSRAIDENILLREIQESRNKLEYILKQLGQRTAIPKSRTQPSNQEFTETLKDNTEKSSLENQITMTSIPQKGLDSKPQDSKSQPKVSDFKSNQRVFETLLTPPRIYTEDIRPEGTGERPRSKREKFEAQKKIILPQYVQRLLQMNRNEVDQLTASTVEGSGIDLSSDSHMEKLIDSMKLETNIDVDRNRIKSPHKKFNESNRVTQSKPNISAKHQDTDTVSTRRSSHISSSITSNASYSGQSSQSADTSTPSFQSCSLSSNVFCSTSSEGEKELDFQQEIYSRLLKLQQLKQDLILKQKKALEENAETRALRESTLDWSSELSYQTPPREDSGNFHTDEATNNFSLPVPKETREKRLPIPPHEGANLPLPHSQLQTQEIDGQGMWNMGQMNINTNQMWNIEQMNSNTNQIIRQNRILSRKIHELRIQSNTDNPISFDLELDNRPSKFNEDLPIHSPNTSEGVYKDSTGSSSTVTQDDDLSASPKSSSSSFPDMKQIFHHFGLPWAETMIKKMDIADKNRSSDSSKL